MATGRAAGGGGNTKPFLQSVWGSVRSFREGTLILVIIVIGGVTALLSPFFLTGDNLSTLILSFAINGISVIGMQVVMVSGGLDLSVGSVIGMVGAIAGKLYLSGVNVWVAAAVALIIAALAGAINGFFITRVGLSPFIATLAMYSIARGAAYVVAQGIPLSLYSMPKAFKSIGTGDIGGVPFVVITLVVFLVVADLMMRRTKVMRTVFYTGSNEKAARFAGINVRGVKMGVYILCSSLAGLAGILSVARFATATPYFATGFELQAISACAIGGASLSGGAGTVLGSVLGIALLSLITSCLILLDFSAYWQDLVSGVILLGAVTLDYLTNVRGK